jgi:restriction system protein
MNDLTKPIPAVWIVRAGVDGEHEQQFMQEQRVFLDRRNINFDLGTIRDRPHLLSVLSTIYPEDRLKTVANWASQLWAFSHSIAVGDLVALPLKAARSIQFGEVRGAYSYQAQTSSRGIHTRPVSWLGDPVPRANFRKDILASFGASQAVCRVHRNQAEARINAMLATNRGNDPGMPPVAP